MSSPKMLFASVLRQHVVSANDVTTQNGVEIFNLGAFFSVPYINIKYLGITVFKSDSIPTTQYSYCTSMFWQLYNVDGANMASIATTIEPPFLAGFTSQNFFDPVRVAIAKGPYVQVGFNVIAGQPAPAPLTLGQNIAIRLSLQYFLDEDGTGADAKQSAPLPKGRFVFSH